MTVIGMIVTLGLAIVVFGGAGLIFWAGWLALKQEVLPGFKTVPPGPGSLILTLLGVILPIVLIGVFTLYLAIWLVRLGFGAL